MFGNKKCSTWSKQPENTEDGIRTGYIWDFLGFLTVITIIHDWQEIFKIIRKLIACFSLVFSLGTLSTMTIAGNVLKLFEN